MAISHYVVTLFIFYNFFNACRRTDEQNPPRRTPSSPKSTTHNEDDKDEKFVIRLPTGMRGRVRGVLAPMPS